MSYYGFNIKDRTHNTGLGAFLHDILLCYHYTKKNNLTLCFTQEGYETEYFKLKYHDLFDSNIPIIPKDKIFCEWPLGTKGFCKYPPRGVEDSYKWYGDMMKELFKPKFLNVIEDNIKRSGFRNEDVLLHIRRTDKIKQSPGSQVESGELILDEYIDPTVEIIRKMESINSNTELNISFATTTATTTSIRDLKDPIPRVFLCTDDLSIVEECKSKFAKHGIEMVYDETQDPNKTHALRNAGGFNTADCINEDLYALTIMTMMKRCKYLVGGRMSYIFRVGELLRYPLPSLNLKDSDKYFGAPYGDEPLANPMLLRRYLNPINPNLNPLDYTEILRKDKIVIIKDFISDEVKDYIRNDLKNKVLDSWWKKALHPSEDLKNPIHLNHDDPKIAQNYQIARALNDTGDWFTYSFWKMRLDSNEHGDSNCNCCFCRLHDTFKSRDVINFINKVVGNEIIDFGEMFASKYSKGDYLNVHFDKNKGDYAYVLSLTQDWKVHYGGLLHFLNKDQTEIVRSIVPSFGNLIIFKISDKGTTHHFVSEVVCNNKSRVAFTGWFNLD